MKTRFAYITLSVIAALVLSSCDKNEVSRPNDFGEPNLTIHLNTDLSLVTRTVGAKEDSASVAEKKISSVRVFLAPASSDGTPVPNTEVMEIGGNMMNFDGSSVQAKVFGLKSNYQLLYVLANCPSTLSVKTDSLAAFIGSYKQIDTAVLKNFWKENNFLMINGVESNAGTNNKFGGVFVDFSSSVSTTVTLERLAAKIVADQDPNIDFSSKRQKVLGKVTEYTSPTPHKDTVDYIISSAEIDAWALMNCVNSFNLIQAYVTDTLSKHYGSGIITTPSSALDYPYPTLGNSLNSTGYYYSNPAVTGMENNVPKYEALNFVPVGDSLYCLENNPPYYDKGHEYSTSGKVGVPSVSDSKMMGRSTAVIFRAQLLLADGFDADATIDEDLDRADGNGHWHSEPPLPTKADTRITATLYSYKSKMYADLDRLWADNVALNGISDPATLRSKGCKVYENGYMYYTYYINKNDFEADYAIPSNIAPYYCVERNKSYKLNVTDVTSFGDDVPCGTGYDPEDPIDRATPRIKVKIEVLPWTVKEDQTYEIKNYNN